MNNDGIKQWLMTEYQVMNNDVIKQSIMTS